MASQVHWEILQAIRSLVNAAATESAAGASEAAFLAVANPPPRVFTPAELGLENKNAKVATNTFYLGNMVDLRGYSLFSLVAKTSFGSLSAPTSAPDYGAFASLLAWPFADSGASVLLTNLADTLTPIAAPFLTSDVPLAMPVSGASDVAATLNWNAKDSLDIQSYVCGPPPEPLLEYLRASPFVKFSLLIAGPAIQPGTVTTSVWLLAQ